MKVSAILKGKIDSNKHQPIQIRISHHGHRTYKPTHIKVDPKLFNNGLVTAKHPKHKEYNELIKTLIIQYQAQALDGFKKKKPKVDLFTYIQSEIKTLKRKPGTLRQYSSQLTKLKEFTGPINITQVDKNFLDRYRVFLESRGNTLNTVWSSFKFLRTFILKAHKEKMIEDYPFYNYEFPHYENPTKDFLTDAEIKKWDKFLNQNVPEKILEAGTWFLIACHTGLRISDIKAFTKKNIIADRLVIKLQKGGEFIGLPLMPKVKKYFQRINYKPLSMHENTYNALLKIIAAAAGVNKHISTHTGRHTAGMMLANAGVSRETIQAILGHKDARSTAIYSKVMNKRIDAELRKLK